MPRTGRRRVADAALLACVLAAGGCGSVSEFLCSGGGPNASCPYERRDPFEAVSEMPAEEHDSIWARSTGLVAKVPNYFFGRDPKTTADEPFATPLVAENDVEAALAAARDDLAAGRHDAARETCERLVASHPGDARPHHLLGVIADLRGEYAAADRHYAAALVAAPEDADLLNDVGYSQILRGHSADAVPYLTDALLAEPGHPRATANLELVGYGTEADSPAPVAVASYDIGTDTAATPTCDPTLGGPRFDDAGFRTALGSLADETLIDETSAD